ncbi:MAG: acyl-CoA dehydrogenase, partial [Rhodobacteraceae bacterium]|nr:acyl-CoA dehydrogenase [Paracoccaceae bacterium]
IKRDVRITTIYEGTSEIMEMTIARARWQEHLKSRGNYYKDWANRMDKIHAEEPNNGADFGAMALRALAVILERCRVDRLTRQQHVLFRWGELVVYAETAVIFSERVTQKPTDAIPLDIPTRQALARIHAREAALKIATDGLRWAIGAGQTDPGLASSLNLAGIYQAQTGLLSDMDFAAEQLNKAFAV